MKRIISFVIVMLLICGMPVSAFAAEYDLAQGSVTVNASESGQTVTHGTNAAVPDSAPVITQSNSSTPTTNTITINAAENATANVTIQGVNINTGSRGGAAIQTAGAGNAVIELDGTNTVQSSGGNAGVQKTNGGNLTIADENGTDGSLKATGGLAGAGIGVGAAVSSNSSDITISGGTIEAIGGENGAGIGGGAGGSGSNITISGGKVTATGIGSASGIGGGAGNSGSNITISGGDVEATGGQFGAAGIGGGGGGSGNNITIEGSAEVTAKGGENGAGIGGGSGNSGSNITISGGNVEATGGPSASGIGGGAGGRGEIITITGSSEVIAKGGLSGAGIGGGQDGTGSNITVSGDTQVKAQGGCNRVYSLSTQYGSGAAIGNGGELYFAGDEVKPKTDALNEGWVATYAPSANMNTDTPNSVAYMDNGQLTTSNNAEPIVKLEPTCTEDGQRAGFRIGNTQVGGQTLPATGHSFTNYVSNNDATYDSDGTKTAECDRCDATHTIPDPGSKLVREEVPQTTPLYRVINQDGKDIPHQAERKDGVLTVTVDADFASLTGSLGGINALKEQGIDTIVFVTKGVSSTFALSDLLAQGSTGDSYTLNHNGDVVSFTLDNGADLGRILQ